MINGQKRWKNILFQDKQQVKRPQVRERMAQTGIF